MVGKDRGLANVVVWVQSQDIPWTPPDDLKQSPATIRFQRGNYSPRMTVLVTGQPLILENYDPISVNFHASFTHNNGINALLPGSGTNPAQAIFSLSAEEELPTHYRSDKDIWADGWLFVRKNRYVAVSQSDGSFTIPDLPVGEWEFHAWHERCGYLRHWPKGLFRQTIEPGDNDLGVIKLAPEQFTTSVPSEGRIETSGGAAPAAAPKRVDAWPIFRGDLVGSGTAATTLPEQPVVVWKRSFPQDSFETTAAIVDGVVYVASLDGKLYALSLASGETRWVFTNSCGFKAAPAVGNGAVYLGDLDGKFHAIDAADGHERWSVASGAEINAGACFYGEKVLFASQDGGLYCLAPTDGKLVWKYAIDEPIQSTPSVVGNRGLLAGCDGKLHVVDLENGAAVMTVDLEDPTLTTPAIAGDVAYWGTQGGRFLAVDWRQGTIVWKYDSPQHRPLLSSAALASGLAVFGGKDGEVRALQFGDGQPVWSFRTGGVVDSSPIAMGNRIFFGSGDGRVYAVDLKNGEQTWKYEAGGSFLASPAAAQGRLIIGNDAGDLYCFGSE
jgi:outer membrane protein assembly factor BamB